MRIDRTHWGWGIFTVAMVVAGAGWYVYETRFGAASVRTWSGGSLAGLSLGTAGYVCMILAALLGARKKVRTWRFGRAKTWMRLHLWLGTAALPLIWLHGGFRHGGPTTEVLMWLLYVVFASGVIGLVLQTVMPRRLIDDVPTETVADQIDMVLSHLATDARLAAAVAGPENGTPIEEWRRATLKEIRSRYEQNLMSEARMNALVQATQNAPLRGSEPIGLAYKTQIAPFMAGKTAGAAAALAVPTRAQEVFAGLQVPPTVTDAALLRRSVQELEQVVTERRDLLRQRRYQKFLHAWLVAHIPLSLALIVLGGVHAVMALRYVWRW
jgi:hypothetical protein